MGTGDCFVARFSTSLERQMDRMPKHILSKLLAWVAWIKLNGLESTRRRTGLHDEPLQGARCGQRSVRLSLSDRAIYIERREGAVNWIEILEVNKHEY